MKLSYMSIITTFSLLSWQHFFLRGPAARNHSTRPLILRRLHKVCKGLVSYWDGYSVMRLSL